MSRECTVGYTILTFILILFLNIAHAQDEQQQDELDACVDKDVGDACSFTDDDGDSIDGACRFEKNEEELTCSPYQ
jgi:hypothetical protein